MSRRHFMEAIGNLDVHDRGALPFLEIGDETSPARLRDPSTEHRRRQPNRRYGPGGDLEHHARPVRQRLGCRSKCASGGNRRTTSGFTATSLRPPALRATQDALTFSTFWLTRPVQLADPMLRQHFLEHIQNLRRFLDLDFRDKAYQALLLLIGTQRCTLDELAAHFFDAPAHSQSPAEGCRHQLRALHNEARHQTARQLLSDDF